MPTGAARLNFLQIKEQQQLNRERLREAAVEEQRAKEALCRQKEQYSHVQSHGYGRVVGKPASDVQIKVYIRECDGERAQCHTFMESEAMRHNASCKQEGKPRPAQPPRQKVQKLPPVAAPPQKKQEHTQQQQQRLSGPANASDTQRGIVPKYLLQRKAELAAQKEATQREAERQREIARYPPGHRLVSEEERKETLEKLAARRRELEMELHKIPIRYDTQSIKERRSKIENELSEIEAAERKFGSAKELFVPI
ncbi:hypothetical protein, conserved [Trypanosoma brucei brucei TREU927]|uniref:Enkurin domain-containing protein n=1 Tax=Trypanosoma brucei brucei (strain 927/4 GUTat10.1) TaxID=185431 RepID=Q38FI9_TRYB2|nr:hypothetical protein, conserved [Trypanosoma brucei brucei TREU927]EAN76431.1 hypothetical protein, conserved [Trypanosoma brucei brucei TREU927]